MHERQLASLHDLQTIYSTTDLYHFLEMIDVHNTLMEESRKEADKKAAASR